MNRSDILASLKIKSPDVLIVGAGINGVGVFRDMALNGVDVLLIDRGDFCSGASAASSHRAHGGIRYLENGEFRLVREAVQERNRMIENAPHLVRPLPTVVPMFKLFSGLLNAPDKIDSVSHDYGPASRQVAAEIDLFLYALERYFFSSPLAKGRTLLLLTADHGQSEIDPATTVYLNRAFPQIGQYLKTNRKGEYLIPGGSCRDMFLYVRDELLDEAQEMLARGLAGKADVVKTEDLIAAGYFGPQVSENFRARVGNLVVLAYRYESVWWYEKDKFSQKYYGHHGGLTPQEMEIPLLGVEL